MARRPVSSEQLNAVVELLDVIRREASVLVQHVALDDRSLFDVGPDHPFWSRVDSSSVFKPGELSGAIVWLKPPDKNLRLQEAADWMRGQGAVVRLLSADRASAAPRQGVEPVRELQISDARQCCAELARELASREGVDVAAVMDAVEQSLSAAGI